MGYLANPASVRRDFVHGKFLVDQCFPGRLTCLFSPQHGFYADKQDNMIESGHMRDSDLGIPVFSLYGETRKPTPEMFDHLDVLLVDLQDVGTRVYTFVYTVSYCMEAARVLGKKIVILDRPNPVGGLLTEGNILRETFQSFVGRFPIPMRHGLTMGEIARLFNDHFGIGCDLDVIPMSGWKRFMYYDETGLPWIAPSPNLPTPVSSYVYPGQVVFEGTNVSEGRGTTQPFEVVGAPYADPRAMLDHLEPEMRQGVYLRQVFFEPTSNKWRGETCKGYHIHILDRTAYQSYALSLALLQGFMAQGKGAFQWKRPPYEYDYDNMPIDLILGDSSIRERLEAMERISGIAGSWQSELDAYTKLKKGFHLYG